MEVVANRELLRMSEQEETALTVEAAKALFLALIVTCPKHGGVMLLCFMDWPSYTRIRTVPWRAFQVPGTEPLTPLAREHYVCAECSEEVMTDRVSMYQLFQGVPGEPECPFCARVMMAVPVAGQPVCIKLVLA